MTSPGEASAQPNPWPCMRCGEPVQIAPRAGRLPRAASFVLLTISALLLAGWCRLGAFVVGEWVLALTGLLLLLHWVLRRHGRRAWRCPQCGTEGRARLLAAGKPSVAIVIPTYNNEASIAEVIRGVRDVAAELPVVVVDDGSTDETRQRAGDALAAAGPAPAGSTLLTHPNNRGKGAALVTALRHAFDRGFSHILCLDGDGQHLPAELLPVRDALLAHPGAIIVGARDLDQADVPGSTRFGRSFSNFWLRVQTGQKLADSQSGLRAYPVAPTLSLGSRTSRYDFEVEVLTLAGRAGVPLRSVPVRVHYPPAQQRVSHFDKGIDNARISWVNTRLLAGAPLWPLGWPARLSRQPPPATVRRAWSGASRGGAAGHLFFIWVLRLLGPRPAYALLFPVALYFMLAARSAVRHGRAFLGRVEGPLRNPWRRFWRSYRLVLEFSRTVLDRAVALVHGPDAFQWSSEGTEHLRAGLSNGGGVLYLSAHLGNYEVAGTCFGTYDIPLSVVMLDAEAESVKAVYARLGQGHRLPKIIATNRSEMPALKILSALRQGEAVALHGDRIIDGNWTWCDFMGAKAALPTGPFIIAAAARVPVVLTFGFREGPRRYRFIAEPPRTVELPRGTPAARRRELLAEHARWYAGRLEHYARQYPLQWANFFDFWQTPEAR